MNKIKYRYCKNMIWSEMKQDFVCKFNLLAKYCRKDDCEQYEPENEYPDLTKQPILHVDLTPDDNLPLRILQAYRENCNCNWATNSDGTCDSPLFNLMNEHNKQRAEILDKAIAKLNEGGKG